MVAYLVAMVGLPLAALVAEGSGGGLVELGRVLAAPVVVDALVLTFWTAALMAAINGVMGTATAWVLVRYRFPGRALLSAVVDLPFAVPTLVTGVMLVLLFGPQETAGRRLAELGLPVVFAPAGIVLALLFVTLPLVVRVVEPVMRELDVAEEEAASTLGARVWTTFRRVILPALTPAIAYGTLQGFARALAEFGSIVVVSGNVPHHTLTAPVLVFGEVESGRTEAAAGVSLVLLVAALGLSLASRTLQRPGAAHG